MKGELNCLVMARNHLAKWMQRNDRKLDYKKDNSKLKLKKKLV